ncbi:MAG: hypothetical protein QXP38_05835 [Nitrososphaerota archaeon]
MDGKIILEKAGKVEKVKAVRVEGGKSNTSGRKEVVIHLNIGEYRTLRGFKRVIIKTNFRKEIIPDDYLKDA